MKIPNMVRVCGVREDRPKAGTRRSETNRADSMSDGSLVVNGGRSADGLGTMAASRTRILSPEFRILSPEFSPEFPEFPGIAVLGIPQNSRWLGIRRTSVAFIAVILIATVGIVPHDHSKTWAMPVSGDSSRISTDDKLEELAMVKEDERYDFCSYDSADYSALKEQIESQFSSGTSADILATVMRNSSGGKEVRRGPVADLSIGIQRDYYIHGYTFLCDLEHDNKNEWALWSLIDKEDVIVDLEFHLFFQDMNFAKRNSQFRFDNFSSEKIGRDALWSVTGLGTTRNQVEQLMQDAGLKKLSSKAYEDMIVDQYRKHPDKNGLSYRLGGINIWVILWEFDKSGNLVDLQIN